MYELNSEDVISRNNFSFLQPGYFLLTIVFTLIDCFDLSVSKGDELGADRKESFLVGNLPNAFCKYYSDELTRSKTLSFTLYFF